MDRAREAIVEWIESIEPGHEAITKSWLDPNKKGTVFYVAGMGATLHTKFVNRASIVIDNRTYGITACTIGYFELLGFDKYFPPSEHSTRGILKKMGINYNGPVVIKRSREKEAPIAAYVLLDLPRGNRDAKKATIQEFEKKSLKHEFKSNKRKYEFRLAFSRARGKKNKRKTTKPEANQRPSEQEPSFWERMDAAMAEENRVQSKHGSRSQSKQSSRSQSRASSPPRGDDHERGNNAVE
jgi:hypothetical protein